MFFILLFFKSTLVNVRGPPENQPMAHNLKIIEFKQLANLYLIKIKAMVYNIFWFPLMQEQIPLNTLKHVQQSFGCGGLVFLPISSCNSW